MRDFTMFKIDWHILTRFYDPTDLLVFNSILLTLTEGNTFSHERDVNKTLIGYKYS